MKKLYIAITAITLSSVSQAQIINIPDPALKNYLVTQPCAAFDEPYENQNEYIDANADGEIQLSEAQAVLGLHITDNNILSLQGIEYFTSVFRLVIGCD